MARSLTVKQEETPRTSWLFLTFVGLCAGLLMLTWFTTSVPDANAEPIEAAAPTATP